MDPRSGGPVCLLTLCSIASVASVAGVGCVDRPTGAPAASTSASTSATATVAGSASASSAPKMVAAKAKVKPKSDPSVDATHPSLFDDKWEIRVSFLDGGPVELAKGSGKVPADL